MVTDLYKNKNFAVFKIDVCSNNEKHIIFSSTIKESRFVEIFSHVYLVYGLKETHFDFGSLSLMRSPIFATIDQDDTDRFIQRLIQIQDRLIQIQSFPHVSREGRRWRRWIFPVVCWRDSGEGPTVFQNRFSGIIVHAATDVIRARTPWTGIGATSAGWRGNLPVGPAGGVSPEWTSCECTSKGRATVWHPIRPRGDGWSSHLRGERFPEEIREWGSATVKAENDINNYSMSIRRSWISFLSCDFLFSLSASNLVHEKGSHVAMPSNEFVKSLVCVLELGKFKRYMCILKKFVVIYDFFEQSIIIIYFPWV